MADYEYKTMGEAIGAADAHHAVIELTYTHDDSELVWTPNNRNMWPPKQISRSK